MAETPLIKEENVLDLRDESKLKVSPIETLSFVDLPENNRDGSRSWGLHNQEGYV